MNNLIWKIREQISRLMPLALIAGLLYGGWTLHKKGTFRHGVGPAVSTVLGKIPYFGSRFRHHLWKQKSTAYRSSKRGRGAKHTSHRSRRHGRRRHR